jgi:hypothetical protein
MLTARDRTRWPSHPPRPGLDAKHVAHLAGNDMTAEACGRVSERGDVRTEMSDGWSFEIRRLNEVRDICESLIICLRQLVSSTSLYVS